MTREEFFEWLNTCPTHKWEITHEEYGHVVVSFPNDEEDNGDDWCQACEDGTCEELTNNEENK